MMRIPVFSFALAVAMLANFDVRPAVAQQATEQNGRTDSNDKAIYDPKNETVEGWTVRYDPRLDLQEHIDVRRLAFKALANHLQRIEFIVPPKRLSELKECRIWMDLDHPSLKGMQYHPSRAWLEKNGCDPRLEKHVHIPVAANLFSRINWAKHPYVVLHELAHAYHDQYLGFDNKQIAAVYKAAKASGKYDSILDHRGKKVRHYGMNNAKEYFAEMTESYFGVNDFYPFVRAELKEFDPEMFRLLKGIWGKVD